MDASIACSTPLPARPLDGQRRASPSRDPRRLRLLPALDRAAELEEGDDPGRQRQPEGDQAIGEDGGEDLAAADARGCRTGRRRRSSRRRRRRPRPGSGIRLANMPTKKPWTTIAIETSAPKAWKDAQRIAMLRRPEADRADQRHRPALRLADERERLAGADRRASRGHVARRRSIRPQPGLVATRAEKRRSRSPGISAKSRKMTITPPAIAAGTMVMPAGAGSRRRRRRCAAGSR